MQKLFNIPRPKPIHGTSLTMKLQILTHVTPLKEQLGECKDYIFGLRREIWRDDWSSQLYTQLKQLWKFQAWTGFEPMISAIPRCSALPIELSSFGWYMLQTSVLSTINRACLGSESFTVRFPFNLGRTTKEWNRNDAAEAHSISPSRD